MTFLLSLVLVIVAGVFAIAALIASNSGLFVISALCAAASVVLIWRRSVAEREVVNLVEEPQRNEARWKTDHFREPTANEPEGLVDTRDLGIDRYDELLAAEVLPSLETLSVEQLRAVVAVEKNGLAREAILRRAERLISLTLGVEVEPELAGHAVAHEDLGASRRQSGPDFGL